MEFNSGFKGLMIKMC